MTDSTAIPVADGLFRDGALMGARCSGCGNRYFPRRVHCPNPDCSDGEMEEVALSRQGTLYSYTIQAYRPPALFRMDPWQPYAIGVVELPEGLRLMSMLACEDLASLAIGMPLELVVGAIGRDAEGRTLQTWQFKPLALGGTAA